MSKIEVGKTYKTRDGRSVRILATDCAGDRPIVGLVDNLEPIFFRKNGQVFHWLPSDSDLIIDPERKSSWINWYAERNNFHASQEAADSNACHDRTHILEVIVEDGKPVDVKIHKVKPD